MFTIRYNGMYINGRCANDQCYVTDDFSTFYGRVFKSFRAAQIAITKARKCGVNESR
jgi:hypothetical protein